jgi:hypothetical protein
VSDTPRTNAILTAILETHGHVGFLNCPPTWVAFSKELERELNAANDRIKRLEESENRMLNWLTEDCPESVKKQLSNAWMKSKEAKP